MTDRQPLTAIFHQGHDYEKHANADGLSMLPLKTGKTYPDVVDIFYTDHVETLPVTAAATKTECNKDPVMSKVLEKTQQGWPTIRPEGLKSLFAKRYDLSVFYGCIIWGNERVLVPQKLRSQIRI